MRAQTAPDPSSVQPLNSIQALLIPNSELRTRASHVQIPLD